MRFLCEDCQNAYWLAVMLGLFCVKLAEISSYFPFISWVIPILVKVYNLKTHAVDFIFSIKLLFNMNVYNKEDSYAAFRIKRKAMDTHTDHTYSYIFLLNCVAGIAEQDMTRLYGDRGLHLLRKSQKVWLLWESRSVVPVIHAWALKDTCRQQFL